MTDLSVPDYKMLKFLFKCIAAEEMLGLRVYIWSVGCEFFQDGKMCCSDTNGVQVVFLKNIISSLT